MKKMLIMVAFMATIQSYFIDSICQNWFPINNGPNNYVTDLCVFNNKLFLCGAFTKVGTLTSQTFAAWNGFYWDAFGIPIGEPGYAEHVNTLAVNNNYLFFGGNIDFIIPGPGRLVGVYDGIQFNEVPGSIPSSPVDDIYAMSYYKNQLYVGGDFNQLGFVDYNRIARWNGATWSGVGGGVTNQFQVVQCMQVFKDELYVGGDFSKAGGKVCWFIARWNGSDWNPVGTGFDGPARTMVADTIRNLLYVSGDFYHAGGLNAIGIAQWDGNKWSNMSNDTIVGIIGMAMYHGDLHVGGGNYGVTLQNGEVTQNLLRWDGKEWHSVGGGTKQGAGVMEIYQDSLYVQVGYDDTIAYKTASPIPAKYLAKWHSPDTYADSCGYNSSYCPKPNAGFNMNYTINDSTVYLTNATTGGCTYLWLFGDGDSATNLNPSHTYSDTGIFNITLFAHAGLRSDTFTSSVHIQVFPTDSCGYTVGNSPKPQAGFVMDSVNGFSVSFENTTIQGCTYKWFFGDGDTSYLLNPAHVYNDTGTFIVTLYAYSGDQSDTVSLEVQVYLIGTQIKRFVPPAFSILPNPSAQTAIINYSIPNGSQGWLKICNFKGEALQVISLEAKKNRHEISTVTLNPGLYLCTLVNEKGVTLEYRKLAVVR